MALVPLLVALLLVRGTATDIAAAVIFAVGAWSDLLDGYLARRWGISTRTGAWLDPLADKLLVAAPILTLLALGRFPLWAAVVILVREAAVVVLRAWLGTRGRGMPARPLAKAKTFAQLVAIFLYILPLSSAWDVPRLAILSLAVALTVVTGVDYAWRARAWTRSVRRAPGGSGGGREPGGPDEVSA
jgi:CDP-diacylglycerol--glycerol-3-phosphate 3-phosphatidyltransferase